MAQNRKKPAPGVVASVLAGAGAALLMASAGAGPLLPLPPTAPSEPATETIFGVQVDDPFRNLEDLENPQTRAWLDAQASYAQPQLARIEGRDAMIRRIETLAASAGDSVRDIRRMPGGRLFYLTRKVGQNQFELVMRVGPDGPERLLVDPDAIARSTGIPHAINYFVPSWDGQTLAYGVSAGGSEDASLRLMDIASGAALGEPIPRVREDAVHWTPDSRHIAYNQLRELPAGASPTETYLDSTVFVLDVRHPEQTPLPLFGPLHNRNLHLDRLDVAEVIFAPDSRYMIARTTDTTVPEGKLYVASVRALHDKSIRWQQLSAFDDKITDAQLRGDTLYLRTYAGAPRGRVLALSLETPLLIKAIEVVPQPHEGVLYGFNLGRESIYAGIQLGFNRRVRIYGGTHATGVDVAPGLAGSTVAIADPAHAYGDVWVATSTWTAPSRVLATKADGSVRNTGLLTSKSPDGAPELEVSEVLVPSHDGAEVPLAIVRRKGLPMDGRNPTLLIGYGAYGFSFEASYDPLNVAWLEQGGVLAYANVRGSGAFGDAWYRAGFKATKSNTWKDGVACARYLIDQHYASPPTLGISGTSAGGIFVGRSVTSAPELFAAAIFNVGVMDAVRAERSANGITNISEFGSAENPAEFPALLEMSTYHQIKDGVAYPAVLLIHGMNDPRVDVWHSAKAAARLQQATASGRPVLLRLDNQAGHGIGSTVQQAYAQRADIYSFLFWQFGLQLK